RSLKPTSRAEENARYVDGFREDDSFLGFKVRESLWFSQPSQQGWLGLITVSTRHTLLPLLRDASLTRFGPRTEDGCAYPNAGGALFNGYCKVVRHAHGKHFHADTRKLAGGNLVAQVAEGLEVGARPLGILGVGRNGHESAHFDLGEALGGLEQLLQLLRGAGYAGLALFTAGLDLDQDRKDLIELHARQIEPLRQAQRIYGVHGVKGR